jgi:recombination protein RecT
MEVATTIAKIIEQTQERFVTIAPSDMKYDAEKGFAIQLLNNNDYLMKTAMENPSSLQQALTNVAAIGLSLNPAEKLAYLIPRSVKTGNQWVSKIFLEPSYVGMIKLATDTGSIKWVQARCVYADDEFIDNGVGQPPTHKYNAFSVARGDFVGVYCVAKTRDNDYLTTIMDAAKTYDIRGRSETYKKYQKGVWVTDFEEMAKKSVIRNAFKTWVRSDDGRGKALVEAIDISNVNEGFEPIVSAPQMGEYTAGQKEYFDQLISSGDGMGLLVLSQSLVGGDASSSGASVWISLTNSFEKGQKGKYRELVQTLIAAGRDTVNLYIEQLEEARANEDHAALNELMNELDDATTAHIKAKVSSDLAGFIGEASND